MKNLKRALSLALSSVMLVGMMAVGAGAASFGDADKIEHTDAVNTMVTLGVIKGDDKGNFDPERTVTRAEMTKMICVALNGGKDPNLSGGGLYPDTQKHWASGYIDYCTNVGIVSGDNHGNFNPDKTVTGTEAAKMILIAIGYNAQNEKYVNDANWALNINVDASAKGLYDDVAVLPAAGLSRDNAAQMLFNGMDATMVEYDYKLNTENGNLVTVAIAKDRGNLDLLADKFDLVRAEDVVLKNVDLDSKGTYTLTTSGVAPTTFTKVAEDYTALLGQKVDVLYKENETDKVYGVYASTDNQVVTYNMSAASVDGGKVKVDGVKYELESCATITDGVWADGPVAAAALTGATSFNTVKLVDNDGDDKYEVAVITTVAPAKVTYASNTEIIAGGNTYKHADENIAEDLKKGDYVTITYNVATEKKDIVKLDKITGKVDGFKTGKVLVNGEWYNFSGSEFVAGDAGKDVEFYAVNGVAVAGTKDLTESTTLDNVVMVLAKDAAGVSRQVKVLFADGTKKVGALDTTSTGAVDPTAGKLYTYTMTEHGYKFSDENTDADDDKIGDYTYTKEATSDVLTSDSKVATLGVSGNTHAISDDAVIFVYIGSDDGKVITGKQLKTLNTGSSNNQVKADTKGGFFTGEVGGMNRVVLAALEAGNGTFSVGNAAGNYALIVDTAYKTDADYITYKIWTGSEVLTVREKNVSALVSRAQMALIKYSAVEEDVIKDVTDAGETKGAVMGLIGDEVSFNGTDMKKLTKDTVYMYYDSSATKAEDIGKAGGELILKYVLDGSDVEFILIDVKNDLKDGTTYNLALTKTADRLATLTAKDVNGDAVEVGSNKVEAGDILTITMTGAATAGEVTVTLTNGAFLDADGTTKDFTVANGATVEFQVVAGAGNLTVAVANK